MSAFEYGSRFAVLHAEFATIEKHGVISPAGRPSKLLTSASIALPKSHSLDA